MHHHSRVEKTRGMYFYISLLHNVDDYRQYRDNNNDDDDDSEEQDSEEGSQEEEEESEEEESGEEKPELTRAQRKEMKKKQTQAKQAAAEDDDDEDADLINPNHVQKKLTISDLNEPRQLTRRERSVLYTTALHRIRS